MRVKLQRSGGNIAGLGIAFPAAPDYAAGDTREAIDTHNTLNSLGE